jgi:hypothetical protein
MEDPVKVIRMKLHGQAGLTGMKGLSIIELQLAEFYKNFFSVVTRLKRPQS